MSSSSDAGSYGDTRISTAAASTDARHRYKVSIQNLNAWFGTKQAIKNINLDIKENTATAIIGPSGCGKTTLIRCLNRMHEMTSGATTRGHVFLDNVDIYDKKRSEEHTSELQS